jgi:N-acetylglutamate synthase-like GNAT family acetyltransferase
LNPARDSSRKRISASVKIRKAKPSDKAPILEISKKIWGGHDYLPGVWDDWVSDKNARFIVATVNGRTVGCAHASLQANHVAWLDGVRVHEEYRGLGIAGKLNHALVQWTRAAGARVARLSTGSSNRASRQHLSKIGFPVMGTFQRLDTTRGLRVKPAGVSIPRRAAKSLWNWLGTRPNFAENHAMYSDGWTWHPLTYHVFRNLVTQGRVLVTLKDGAPSSCCIFLDEEKILTLGFVAGDRGEVVKLIRMLRFLKFQRKREKLRVLLPFRSSFLQTVEGLGFKRSAKILVYEKFLG